MEQPGKKPPLGERLKTLLAEYGMYAVAVYLSTSILVYGGTALAITTGFELEGVEAGASILGAGFIMAKITQPVRILATLAITPVIVQLVSRRRRRPSDGAEL